MNRINWTAVVHYTVLLTLATLHMVSFSAMFMAVALVLQWACIAAGIPVKDDASLPIFTGIMASLLYLTGDETRNMFKQIFP